MVTIRLLKKAFLHTMLICFTAVSSYCSNSDNLILQKESLDQSIDKIVNDQNKIKVFESSNSFFFIDSSLNDSREIKKAINKRNGEQFHLFSHGKSGQLFLEGKWYDQYGIYEWMVTNVDLSNKDNLNIYGCEFAKGAKGKAAVSYLETALGVSVSASDDVTGIDGDWELEVGNRTISFAIPDYNHNLQTGPNDDFDGDGVLNFMDLDDDNDGILDAVESPDCFYTEAEALMIVSVTTDGVYPAAEQDELDALATGSTTAGFNFTNAQDINGGSYFTVEISDYVAIQDFVVTMVNTRSFMNSLNNTTTTNTTVILQGSVDGINWIDLSSAVYYDRTATGNQEVFTVTQNSGNYKFYRLKADASSSDTYSTGTVNGISFTLPAMPEYVSSAHPKTDCTEDADGDTVYNHQDLDSDGDGCSDAVEASVTPSADLVDDGSLLQANFVFTQADNVDSGDGHYDGAEQTTYAQYALNDALDVCEDTDGDGIGDLTDLDDDNDGILDAVESPDCFYTEAEALMIVSVTTDGVYPTAEQDELDALATGSTTAGFNFTNAQDINGGSYFTVEISDYVAIQDFVVTMANTNSFMNSSNNTTTTNTTVILQGSADGISWIDLSSAVYHDRIATGSQEVFTVTQNSGNYKFYRLKADASSSNTYSAGTVNGISFTLPAMPEYVSSAHPKADCTEDADGDTVYNHQDLDSDGDGCSDAVEASVTPSADLVDDGSLLQANFVFTQADNVDSGDGHYDGAEQTTYSQYALNDALDVCEDTDGDGIGDLTDLDDDNDGILDAVESPDCFYTEAEALAIVSVTTDGVYPTAEQDELDALATGSTTAGFNFTNAQDINGGSYFTVEISDYVAIQDFVVTMANTSSFMNSSNNTTTTNTTVILQGSVDGISWIDLSSAVYYDRTATGSQEVFTVTQNSGNYKFYRLKADASSSDTYSAGTVNGISFTLPAMPEYVSSAHPKADCTEDADGDNIYNHQDLDSDGDGCSDAVEAGVTPNGTLVDDGALENAMYDFISPANDTNNDGHYDGTTISGDIKFAQDDSIDACLDTDGDGIADVFDLDDDNDGILDTEECSTKALIGPVNSFGYHDAVLHANHHSGMYLGNDGVLYTWGQNAGIDGENVSTGVTAYGPYPGDLLGFTGGGLQGSVTQFILTTEGLYASGLADQVVSSAIFPGGALAPVGLPPGVAIGDIVDIEATFRGLHILTDDGLIHTILGSESTRNFVTYGDGTATRHATDWHTNNALPNGQKIVQFKPGYNAVFALTDAGKLYAWGRDFYLGDGTGVQTSLVPVEITPPAGVTVTQVATSDAFRLPGNTPALVLAVLGTNGMVYTIGAGQNGLLGNGTHITSNTWQTVIDSNNDVVNNAINLSGSNNDERDATFSILTNSGQVKSWGENNFYTIGTSPENVDKNRATDPNESVVGSITSGNVIGVANGGHITPIFTNSSLCGVGHNVHGSFGFSNPSSTAPSYVCYDQAPILSNPFVSGVCDFDGDGIPNNLDLDSDGDGCPDAIEGGGTFTDTDLVNSGMPGGNADTGDGMYNGTSMDPIDSNLGNIVDMDGVPVSAAGGQDVGSSQDVDTNECVGITNAENDINQTPAGVAVDGNVLTNDSDPDGDTQMVTSVMGGFDAAGAPLTIPTDGTPTTIYEEDPDAPGTYIAVGEIEFNTDGSYTFTPADGFSGDVPTLTYEITDSTGATDTATLDIDVIPVDDPEMNDVPVANDDTNTTDQGVAVEGGLLGNDSDPDGDMLTVTTITIDGVDYPVDPATGSGEIMIPGVGTIEVAADGTYTFTPDPDFVGDVPPIGYTVEDPSGESADAVLAIEVVADPDGMSNNTYANDDSSIGESGAAQSTNLISNDNDPEGEDQTIQSVTVFDMSGMPVVVTDFTAAVNVYDEEGNLTGTLMVDPLTGDVTFTPEPGFVGTIPIEYTVVDTDGNTDTATYYPTVLAPLETNAENDINQTPAGVAVDGNVLTNDNDPEGDTQMVTSVMGGLDAAGAPLTIPTDGTPTTIYEEDPDAPGTYIAVGEIEFNADGSYTFTPADGFSGDVPTLTYEITDSTGATDTATLDIDVIPVDDPEMNDVPVANDDTNTTDQGVAVEGGLLGNDSDPDGDMLTVTTITIGGVDYPVDPATGSGEIMIPGVGTIEVAADGTYTFTPDPDFVGDVPPIGYTVEDPSGESADAVLAIEVVADPDGMSNNTYANDDSSVGESGAAQSTNLISNDNDPEGEDQTIQSVTVYDMSGMPVVVTDFTAAVNVYDEEGNLTGTLMVDPLTGDVTFTPEPGFVGTIPIEYTVVDTDGNTDTATYYPTVLAPLETNAENDINQTPEGVPVDGNVLTNDNDPEGDAQTVTSVMGGLDAAGAPLTIPTDGTPTTIYEEDPDAPGTYIAVGEIEFNADGSYTFTPEDGFSGDVPTLTYEITDSTGATDTATLDIDVIPVDDPEMNDVPVANDDTNTTDQGVAVEGGLLGNDSDPDGDMLTVTSITIGGVDYPVDPATGSGEIMIPGVGTIEVAADGTYTFTPDPDFVGDVPPIGYTVEDPSGESADAVLAIEVVADPDGMSNNTYANDDSSVGESGAAQSTNLISNDNDPEGEDQTIQSVTVFDMSGMPVVVTDFTAAVNVYDEEGNLTGTLMVDPLTGDVTFTPEPGFVGTIPIEYTVVDTDGNTDTATYYPTVLAPLETNAENDINQTPEGVPVDGNVLTNDNDPTGDAQTVTSVMGGLDAAGAPLTIPTDGTPTTIYEEDPDAPGTYIAVGEIEFNADGSYTFTPEDGFSGDVPTLTYEITDSTGATDTATLDIDVIPVDDPEMNDVPVANDDTNTTDQGVAVEGGLLGNDSDPDGDMLTVTSITIGGVDYPVDPATGSGEIMIPGVGTIEVAADGTYTFTPDPDFVGDVPPIGYTVEDPSGESADAVLAIEVVADPDGMSNNTYANDDSTIGESGAAQSTNLISNDNDPEGEDQTIQSVTVFDMSGMPVVVTDFTAAVNVYDEEGNLTGTLMVDPLTGDVTFTPEPGFVGTIPIEYTVVDTDGNTDTATYYPTVLAPLETNAENDINQTPEGVPVDGNVLTNDNDPTGDAQTVTSVMGGLDAAGAPLTIPTDGTPTTIYEEDPDAPGTYIAVGEIEFNADGSYTFTPEDGFSGDVPTLTYEITDSTGATDTATLGLNVIPLDVPAANDVPIANDDTNTTDQGVAVEGGLLGNDYDSDGDMLTVTSITINGVDYPVNSATGSGEIMIPGVGTIEVAADGTYTFTPDPDFVGDVPPIGYTIEDPSGESADAVLAIEVVADPDGMSNNTYANDDSTIGESGAAQSTNLISNDNDPEGEDQTIQSVTVFDMSGMPVVVTDFLAPVNVYDENGTLLGALVVNPLTGDVTFTPEPDFVGTIPIEYTAVDSDGNTDTATYYPTTLPEVVDLPIELYSFRVSKQGENSLLNWITLSELNNEYFNVERSLDGVNFEIIGRVEGSGTTLDKQEYFFTDKEVERGINYYRLNQFDFDGKSSYSPIRTLRFDGLDSGTEVSFNLYPNPVYDKVVISSSVEVQDHKFRVYNAVGQVMRSGTYKAGMELDMTSFEPGVYIFNIVDKGGIVVNNYRLVKL